MKAFVDASVIVAILKREAAHEELLKQLMDVGSRFYVSPLVRFEATAALAKLEVDYLQQNGKSSGSAEFRRLLFLGSRKIEPPEASI